MLYNQRAVVEVFQMLIQFSHTLISMVQLNTVALWINNFYP